MEIVTHLIELEMCIENIAGHIVRITGSETDTIQSFDGVDFLQKFTERGFCTLLRIPLQLLAIPELFLCFFPVAVDILPKQSDFFGSF